MSHTVWQALRATAALCTRRQLRELAYQLAFYEVPRVDRALLVARDRSACYHVAGGGRTVRTADGRGRFCAKCGLTVGDPRLKLVHTSDAYMGLFGGTRRWTGGALRGLPRVRRNGDSRWPGLVRAWGQRVDRPRLFQAVLELIDELEAAEAQADRPLAAEPAKEEKRS